MGTFRPARSQSLWNPSVADRPLLRANASRPLRRALTIGPPPRLGSCPLLGPGSSPASAAPSK
eukprot:870744-Alexandrium_andersonii.AAC.1